jgi:hypothetical protein
LATEVQAAVIGNITPVYLAVFDAFGREGTGASDGVLSFTVSPIGEASNLPLAVDYRVVSESAIENEDFAATSGTLTWAAGDLSDRQIDVAVFADGAFEGDETFKVVLEQTKNAALLRGLATGSIYNDDALQIEAVNGQTDEFVVSIGNAFAVITRNGEEVFSGPTARDAQIRLAADAEDSVLVYSEEEATITLADGYSDDIALTVDNLSFAITGGPQVTGDAIPTISGAPQRAEPNESLDVAVSVTEAFLDTSAVVTWSLQFDGTEVDAASGEAAQLSSTKSGLHSLVAEIQDGYRSTTLRQELYIGGDGPVAVDETYAAA